MANLQYSYTARDIDLYSECFSEDFEFFMPEECWADYDGDGLPVSCWGLNVEMAMTEAMFESEDLVELSLVGSSELSGPEIPQARPGSSREASI